MHTGPKVKMAKYLLRVYLLTTYILAYLSKNTRVLLNCSQFHIFFNAQIPSNLKLCMLQHLWVTNSLKIKAHKCRLYGIFRKNPQYRVGFNTELETLIPIYW
jgi:hypothetical protein